MKQIHVMHPNEYKHNTLKKDNPEKTGNLKGTQTERLNI